MNEIDGYDVEDLAVGQRATFSKTITEADIAQFAGVSGDHNAIHVNEAFAATSRFGGCIAHGFLTASMISAAVANQLPGPGTIYLSQQLNFRAPVRPGQLVNASVVVSAIDRVSRRVTLETVCRVGETVVVDGHALVLATSSARRQKAAADARTTQTEPT